MKILTFTMEFDGEKWPIYLENVFGKETADKLTVESHQRAKNHEAKISMLNYSNNSGLLAKLKENEKVTSAYIAEGKGVTQVK